MAKTKSATTKSAKTRSARAKSAKAKSAARSVALKKSAPRKKVAASTSRTKAKSGKPRASAARSAPAKQVRPKQRFVVSHHREEDFRADGLRAYAQYRDLGIAEGTHGLARAHVIRLIGPCDPKEVSKLHFHGVEFQMVYVLKGWVKTYLEGEGEIMMREGSSWTQPPRIRHLIRDYSDDCELLEVILPADFETVEL
ncbi:cupin domain-containing protein [Afipia massiliensis]|uniref:Cupin domain-containing protein n=1 Tax=Afipia massiliensis TaxID=211460 RepID=A0A4U6BRK2_9BRAD|nr:cupin domain-containing protein [Afipia massiliensis]TKT72591.1 cupin domain-containing protein [Afipia massiliensis]